MKTWRDQLARALHNNKENWSYVHAKALDESDLDKDTSAPIMFTVWTTGFVYVPFGDEVVSVPRHPCDQAMRLDVE